MGCVSETCHFTHYQLHVLPTDFWLPLLLMSHPTETCPLSHPTVVKTQTQPHPSHPLHASFPKQKDIHISTNFHPEPDYSACDQFIICKSALAWLSREYYSRGNMLVCLHHSDISRQKSYARRALLLNWYPHIRIPLIQDSLLLVTTFERHWWVNIKRDNVLAAMLKGILKRLLLNMINRAS